MFGFIKKMFIGLLSFNGSLASIVYVSDHTKWISLNNQPCMTQPSFINLLPNEYIQGLPCYPFEVDLDNCTESCNTLNDTSYRMRSKQSRRCKFKHFWYDNRNK